MKAHQLDSTGLITNTIEVERLDVFPNLVDATLGGVIGDRIVSGTVTPKPKQEPTADQNAAAIRAKIAELEQVKQPRAQREAILNGDTTRLRDIDNQIAALRTQLVK